MRVTPEPLNKPGDVTQTGHMTLNVVSPCDDDCAEAIRLRHFLTQKERRENPDEVYMHAGVTPLW